MSQPSPQPTSRMRDGLRLTIALTIASSVPALRLGMRPSRTARVQLPAFLSHESASTFVRFIIFSD